MKFLLITLSTLLFASSAFARYPIKPITCQGTNEAKHKVTLNITGSESADPATRKTYVNVSLNLKATTAKGNVVIKNLDLRGLKITSGSLVMYSISSEIPNNDYNSLTLAITNKDGDNNSLVLVDTNSADLDSESFTITCDRKVN